MRFTPRYISVLRRPQTPYWYMRFRDPETGKEILRTTRCTLHADALGVARQWAKELKTSVINPEITAIEQHLDFVELAIPELSPLQRGRLTARIEQVLAKVDCR